MKMFFRKEVLDNKKITHNFGTLYINTPPTFKKFVAGLSIIIILIGIFVIFGEFSEKFIVTGYINSDKPIINIYPKVSGIILKNDLYQGKSIKKGDILFLIDTSYAGLGIQKDKLNYQLNFSKKLIEFEIINQTNQFNQLKALLKKKFISVDEFYSKKAAINELKRRKSSLEMEIIRNQQSSYYPIVSPITGVISAVNFQLGQSVQISKPLIKIRPANSKLVAEIFIPVRKAGFLKKDNDVLLQFDAYPYQRFGAYRAKIKSISQTILIDDEEDKPIKIGEPYYKVIATLNSQRVRLYGKEKKITPGMTFTAITVGMKRKVWQWIFDPLYSYYGSLFT